MNWYTDIGMAWAYGAAVSMWIGYAAVTFVAFLAGTFALKRLAWPAASSRRLGLAAATALLWPLAIPALCFGSVGLLHLYTGRRRPEEVAAARVAPAA